jgi:PKD domain
MDVEDGTDLLVVWDFGDGGQGGGDALWHTYTAPGAYDAKVTVTDRGGKSATATVCAAARPVGAATAERRAAGAGDARDHDPQRRRDAHGADARRAAALGEPAGRAPERMAGRAGG